LDEYDLLHTMIGAGRRSEDVIPAAETGDYLVILEGADPGKVVEIGEEPLTIGRDARQTIVFATDSEVSRLHARVRLLRRGVGAQGKRSPGINLPRAFEEELRCTA